MLPEHGAVSLSSHQPDHRPRCQSEQMSASVCPPRAHAERRSHFPLGASSIFHVLQSLALLHTYNDVIIYQTSYQAVFEAPEQGLLGTRCLWSTYLFSRGGGAQQSVSLPAFKCSNFTVETPRRHHPNHRTKVLASQ